jgi:hypothetical protein
MRRSALHRRGYLVDALYQDANVQQRLEEHAPATTQPPGGPCRGRPEAGGSTRGSAAARHRGRAERVGEGPPRGARRAPGGRSRVSRRAAGRRRTPGVDPVPLGVARGCDARAGSAFPRRRQVTVPRERRLVEHLDTEATRIQECIRLGAVAIASLVLATGRNSSNPPPSSPARRHQSASSSTGRVVRSLRQRVFRAATSVACRPDMPRRWSSASICARRRPSSAEPDWARRRSPRSRAAPPSTPPQAAGQLRTQHRLAVRPLRPADLGGPEDSSPLDDA